MRVNEIYNKHKLEFQLNLRVERKIMTVDNNTIKKNQNLDSSLYKIHDAT